MEQEAIDKVMAELRQKYPVSDYDLVPLELRAGLFVLRNPSHQEHMLYKKMILDEGQQHMASQNIFVPTCVYPDQGEVLRALKRYPGLLMNKKVQQAISYLSGATDTLEGKG